MSDSRLRTGIGVSPGIAIGPVYVMSTEMPEITHRAIASDEVETELFRLRKAISDVSRELDLLREHTLIHAGKEESKIFSAQIQMLEDSYFLGEIESLISENQLTAERAFEFKVLEMRDQWGQSASATLRQKTADLTGIQIRVLQALLGGSLEEVLHGSDDRPAIVLMRELTPGLTVQFEQSAVSGLGSEHGTRASHAAIIARSLEIPCVMGLAGGVDDVPPGSTVILDGTHGTILIDPTDDEIAAAHVREGQRLALDSELKDAVAQPCVTSDGVPITLRGNVDLPEEIAVVSEYGADGVGLLRTEFLLIGRNEMPDEEEQTEFFTRLATWFPTQPIVIRSYDVGGDKFPAAFRAQREANPFLGWRAIRVCLDEPEMFRTQIRAVLRTRALADVRLMLPLVSQIEEIERSRELVAEEMEALEREGIEYGADLPLGVMVETPAAAMMVDQFAEQSAFISVGTNDLTQYTLAIDRGNARLANRFSSLHPAVVRLLKQIVDSSARANLEVSVCGEMASEPLSLLLLLGLGYRVVSTSPVTLPLVRWLVRQFDLTTAERAAATALEAPTARDVHEVLEWRLSELVDLELLDLGPLPGS
jgi:phosphotransferase system enzyme I (PtsI)